MFVVRMAENGSLVRACSDAAEALTCVAEARLERDVQLVVHNLSGEIVSEDQLHLLAAREVSSK